MASPVVRRIKKSRSRFGPGRPVGSPTPLARPVRHADIREERFQTRKAVFPGDPVERAQRIVAARRSHHGDPPLHGFLELNEFCEREFPEINIRCTHDPVSLFV
ncbi:hypothetical protein [Defluviimonas salinarum]|uniref:Uncharacterized protein n=1 Tax=Defluviimonas salinarum TaxID=2992147 RepID=A0ABT3J8Y2_9RHOB|nr:hypothetical protein [Defluviimonas salinarum]MCW3783895.1 hypothetical protein [Defluviimonas salinarum]